MYAKIHLNILNYLGAYISILNANSIMTAVIITPYEEKILREVISLKINVFIFLSYQKV